ncbi:hypothetical protein [Photobacterium kishitanii]|uniref:hypothetical protein n=1 Tax=Photobacterium kishitanii TaxID=318456 RepID=UPI00071AF125|nr:hypothetical protein [Photobacterium kishitanii]
MDKVWIGLIGVVVGSALTVLREYFSEWRANRTDARYLAVRLTCLLENFVGECFEVVCDNGEYDDRDYLTPTVLVPKLNINEVDGKWQSLPFEFMYEALNLPNCLTKSNEQISLAIEYGDGVPAFSDFFNERQYQFSILGLKAATLSTKLRKKYSMPAKSYGNWKPIERFIENKNKYEASKKGIFKAL